MFLAELHALYQALDRVEMADDDKRNFIFFSYSKSALLAIWGQDWRHPLFCSVLEHPHWLVQYH